jgi:hypothetical protein
LILGKNNVVLLGVKRTRKKAKLFEDYPQAPEKQRHEVATRACVPLPGALEATHL